MSVFHALRRYCVRRLPAQRLLVLNFHRVLPQHDPFDAHSPDRTAFVQQLQALEGFEVLPLDTGLTALAAGALERPAVALTFDDGYREHLSVVAPLLAARGLPATVFASSGFLEGDNMWHDRLLWACRQARAGLLLRVGGVSEPLPRAMAARRSLADRIIHELKRRPLAERDAAVVEVEQQCQTPPLPPQLLDRAGLRELAAQPGMSIGGHTRHHPILTSCSDAAARAEIAGCRADLTAVLGQPVPLFAYPNGHAGGDFGEREVQLVREAGFSHAVTSDWGVATVGVDPYRVPRLGLYRRTLLGNTLLLMREALRAAAR
jgi:peptidoglycan/xylan/chitin deacetylase (PgdA/CDA1 family)